MTDEGVELVGMRALVIGAGTPAGRDAAVALAGAGADVAVAAGSLDGEEVMTVRRVRRAVEALGRRSFESAMDLALGANIRVSVRQVAKEMGGLGILVNAADAYLQKDAEATSDSEWSKILNVNLNGVFYACRSALKEMAGRGGRIINLCSVLGERGAAGSAAYCAAKHGVVGLTRALALEYAGRDITINAIAVDAVHGEQPGEPVPAGMRPELPDRLGPLVVHLASPAGARITGLVITVAGSAAGKESGR